MTEKQSEAGDVRFDLPLYDELLSLDGEICDRFPAPKHEADGVAGLGISFANPSGLQNGDYWCTPLNTLSFAWTGGDGEHYSFFVSPDAVIDSQTPIVLTAPSGDYPNNLIVAPTLEIFLRAGITRAFFGISQFAYAKSDTLEAYGNPNWRPTKPGHQSVGYLRSDHEAQISEFVASKLNLEPYWYTAEQYESFQTVVDQLIMSEEYHEMYED